jgi:hypothetical protein
MLVAGVAALVLFDDQVSRVDTVPATPEKVLSLQSGQGPWRLPADSAEVELLDATTVSFPAQFSFAVNDAAEPTRWVAVMYGRYDLSGQHPIRSETLTDGILVSIYEPTADSITGAAWITATAISTGRVSTGPVTVAYRGVSEGEVVAALRTAIEADPEPSSLDQVPRVLSQFAPGLVAVAGAEPIVDSSLSTDMAGFGFSARIRAADGRQLDPLDVTLVDTGLPPAVAGLSDRLIIEASRSEGRQGLHVTDRPDLGPGAFTVSIDAVESPFLYDTDGTSIRVSNTAMSVAAPPTLNDQLGLVSSLVPMTRQEVEAELTRRGVSGLDTDTGNITTTTYETASSTTASGP